MILTDDQKAAISKWIEAGASLSEIQKRLKEEFQISITYLEARLLADDLKLALKEPERPPEPRAAPVRRAGKASLERQSFGYHGPDYAAGRDGQWTRHLFRRPESRVVS